MIRISYIMIYDTVSKGEDGLYHVRAFTDERKRKFIQLNDVKIVEKTGDGPKL